MSWYSGTQWGGDAEGWVPPVVSGGGGGLAALTSILPAGSVLRLFDTQDGTSVTSSSGLASAWADTSGNSDSATQATDTHKPSYSATGWVAPDDSSTIPAVLPNSTDPADGNDNDYMDFTSPSAADGFSI